MCDWAHSVALAGRRPEVLPSLPALTHDYGSPYRSRCPGSGHARPCGPRGRWNRSTGVHYYSADVADTYSSNLRDDVMNAFARQGFQTSAIAFTPSVALGPASDEQGGETPSGNAVAAGRDTCGYHGFVFFAGRGVPDYGDFLSGAEQCTPTAVFIGDDDVSRYVASATLRGQYSVPYYYVSFAPAPMASPPGAVRDFYTELKSLFRFEQQPSQDRSLDDHTALSYDAALVVITATEYLREGPPALPATPGNVWRQITAIHSAQTSQPGADKAIDGATGTIDYGGDNTQHVPPPGARPAAEFNRAFSGYSVRASVAASCRQRVCAQSSSACSHRWVRPASDRAWETIC